MKKSVFRFGIYAFTCAALLFLVILYLGRGLDFGIQEILGYLTIFTSLAFVFFGIKHFRDTKNNGKLSLASGMIIGVSISAFAATGFTISDTLYVTLINPDFAQQYMEYTLENMKEELSPSEFEVQKAALQEKVGQYSDPVFNAAVMFLTVFVIGAIISILSAWILHRKN